MAGQIRNPRPVAELDVDDLTQEIDEPFRDRKDRGDEPTLTKIDFDDNEISLDF
ncbi:MAG TPA: hypothetical protein VE907_01615 [Gammaproteobacteria bacterium]|nr:hypothetical protein [Gammaproteobacteria bacterium]